MPGCCVTNVVPARARRVCLRALRLRSRRTPSAHPTSTSTLAVSLRPWPLTTPPARPLPAALPPTPVPCPAPQRAVAGDLPGVRPGREGCCQPNCPHHCLGGCARCAGCEGCLQWRACARCARSCRGWRMAACMRVKRNQQVREHRLNQSIQDWPTRARPRLAPVSSCRLALARRPPTPRQRLAGRRALPCLQGDRRCLPISWASPTLVRLVQAPCTPFTASISACRACVAS